MKMYENKMLLIFINLILTWYIFCLGVINSRWVTSYQLTKTLHLTLLQDSPIDCATRQIEAFDYYTLFLPTPTKVLLTHKIKFLQRGSWLMRTIKATIALIWHRCSLIWRSILLKLAFIKTLNTSFSMFLIISFQALKLAINRVQAILCTTRND